MATFGIRASPFVISCFKTHRQWRVFLLINNPFEGRKLLQCHIPPPSGVLLMRASCANRSISVAVTADDFRSKMAQAADTEHFEAVFKEQWPRVYSVLFRLVGDRAEAEDLALEAFWRLYRRSPRSEDNLAAWLYRVATNLGLNALRSRRRRTLYEEAAGKISLETDPPAEPPEELERAEQRRLVQAALAGIKPQSARLLVLRHSGLSYVELASVLGVAPSSSGTLLARAEAEFEKHYRRLEEGGE
jgi:RNA polymerase sigma-70 factor (ECF subfamily)